MKQSMAMMTSGEAESSAEIAAGTAVDPTPNSCAPCAADGAGRRRPTMTDMTVTEMKGTGVVLRDYQNAAIEIEWESLEFEDLKPAVADEYHGLQRRTTIDAWNVGRGLRAVRDQMQRGEWSPYLASYGITSSSALRFMALAEIETRQVGEFPSVDAALKSLPPKRPKERPKEPDPPAPADPDTMDDAEAQAAAEEVATEAERERQEIDTEKRQERLAIRLEGTEGGAVDALGRQLDKADTRHRDDIQAVKDMREEVERHRRKARDICDALLRAMPSTALDVIDEVLATHFGVARK